MNPKNGNETKSDIFHGAYSNLTPYLFLSKNIKVLQRLSKSKFLSFITKVNPNSRNETKSNIFPWDIFKSDTIPFLTKKKKKYLNDLQNQNFSVL